MAILRTISEGWYVEYKSELLPAKGLAKSMSAFANHYGGWLFIGIQEQERKASSFPGIDEADVPKAEEQLRNASKDCMSPSAQYEHRVICGPVDAIGLPAGRAILVVMVPLGRDAPYVHCGGRIYRRIADSSEPAPETDRAVLDALWRRGQDSRKALKKRVTRSPVLSKGESNYPFIHVFISHDPLSQSGSGHLLKFDAFAKIMRGGQLPFDNLFSHSGGYTARQVTGNNSYNRIFTWEYDFHGHSWVTVPIVASSELATFFVRTITLARFVGKWQSFNGRRTHSCSTSIFSFTCSGMICQRHNYFRRPVKSGPFSAKTRIQNVWRCVPYVDTEAFVAFVTAHGIPVVQTSKMLAPPGTYPDSFVVLDRSDTAADDESGWISDGGQLAAPVLHALGIPYDVLLASANELAYLLGRSQAAQEGRKSPTSVD